MRRIIPSVHSKSHENRANHRGRSGGPSALARALDPSYTVLNDTGEDYSGSSIPTGERTTVDMTDTETPMDFTNYESNASYDEATGPLDQTRRNRGIEWAPTEYEQEQNRYQRDMMLDAVSDAFKEMR